MSLPPAQVQFIYPGPAAKAADLVAELPISDSVA